MFIHCYFEHKSSALETYGTYNFGIVCVFFHYRMMIIFRHIVLTIWRHRFASLMFTTCFRNPRTLLLSYYLLLYKKQWYQTQTSPYIAHSPPFCKFADYSPNRKRKKQGMYFGTLMLKCMLFSQRLRKILIICLTFRVTCINLIVMFTWKIQI